MRHPSGSVNTAESARLELGRGRQPAERIGDAQLDAQLLLVRHAALEIEGEQLQLRWR